MAKKIFIILAAICAGNFFVSPAQAATLVISPQAQNLSLGRTVTVSILVNTSQSINSAEGLLEFPTSKLEVLSVSKTNSIFSLWVVPPTYSNAGLVGTVRFQGVKLNPGFTGNNGKVIDVVFRVKEAGVATVSFRNGAVLANDGFGTNIVSAFGSGTYTLRDAPPKAPALVRPETPSLPSRKDLPPRPVVRHFIQTALGKDALFTTSDEAAVWSKSLYAKLTWTLPPNATGVVTALDDSSDTDPGDKSEGMIDTKLYPLLPEGKHYFHIRFLGLEGPGDVLHYPLFIDVHPPAYFSLAFAGSEEGGEGMFSTSNPRPAITFFTEDALSGIDRYEIKIGDGEWIRTDEGGGSQPFVLPKQLPNKKQRIVVRALDRAGNAVDAGAQFVVTPVVRPTILGYPKRLWSPRDPLFIEGTASPGADIELILRQKELRVLFAKADEEGSWRIVDEEALLPGLYSVLAKQTIGNGAESVYTEPLYIKVSSSASVFIRVITWFEEGNGYFLVAILLVLQALMFLYYRYRLRHQMMEYQDMVRNLASPTFRPEPLPGDPSSGSPQR